MKSRMEKYYKQDLSEFQRVKKNKDLYKSVYNLEDEFSDLPVSENYMELDIKDIKNGITSREEYKRAKELGNITNSKVKNIDDEFINDKKEEKVYDINKMLEEAKNNNNFTKEERDLVSDKYLRSLEEFIREEKVELIKDKQEIHEEMNKQLEEKLKETASLSLDILSDLKPDNDTIVTTPIKEELKNKTEEKIEEKDDAFYSGTYSFTKEDFEDKSVKGVDNDFTDLQGNKITNKIILLSFGILVCVAMLVLIYFYVIK